MPQWKLVSEETPPQKKVLKTKIVDAEGKEHNEQELILSGKLWWHPDMSMYVYYTPTHWWCRI
jgi:hypothetical protein